MDNRNLVSEQSPKLIKDFVNKFVDESMPKYKINLMN